MLPQLALNARIIFLLMVMFAFATKTTECTSQTNDYVIMLKTHNDKALHINAGGRVTAADISLAQFFTMNSIGDYINGIYKLTLYSKEVGLYLCFRRGRLVGSKNLTPDCHFTESLDRGYFLYSNAYNQSLRIGFTRRFKPIGPNHLARPQSLRNACFLFVKIRAEHFDHEFFTTRATKIEAATTQRQQTKRRRLGQQAISSSSSSQPQNNHGDSEHGAENQNISRRRKNQRLRRLRGQRHGSGSGQLIADNNEASTSVARGQQQAQAALPKQRTRKRKQPTKSVAGQPQPKNLVRHHHDNSTLVERRRQHEREQKQRHMRKQLQRQQREQQPTPASSSSSSTTTASSAFTATASLAPSALNIVAMLAASRRKRGRRKSLEADDGAAAESNDMQIASASTTERTIIAAAVDDEQRFYSSERPEHHRHRHHHQLHQRHQHQHQHQHQLSSAAATNSNNDNAEQQQQQLLHASLQQNEYSNSYLNDHKSNVKHIKSNHNAIPALPKNLYHNENNNESNRLTDYSSRSKFSSPRPHPRPRRLRRSSLDSYPIVNNSNSSANSYLSQSTNLRSKRSTTVVDANADADDAIVSRFSSVNNLFKTNANLINSKLNEVDNNFKKYLMPQHPNINRNSELATPAYPVHVVDVVASSVNVDDVHNNDDDNDDDDVENHFSLKAKVFHAYNVNHNDYDDDDDVNNNNQNINDVDVRLDVDKDASALALRKRLFRVHPSLRPRSMMNNHNKYEKTIVQYRYEVSFISTFQLEVTCDD